MIARMSRMGRGWTIGLLIVAAAFLGLGVLQLTRALPKTIVEAHGTVFGFNHDPGGKYSGESWDVFLDIPGVGTKDADSHAIYRIAQRHPAQELPVVVHLRGGAVKEIQYQGRWYGTAAVSRTEAWIETFLFGGLGAALLLLIAAARWVRWRASRPAEPNPLGTLSS
jgi:hypothetical protein